MIVGQDRKPVDGVPMNLGMFSHFPRYTSWCREIGSLMSLDACNQVHPMTSEHQFHYTKLHYRRVSNGLGWPASTPCFFTTEFGESNFLPWRS